MKKINIRESLLKLDKATCCEYDLTTLYEACNLDDKDKQQLVKYIATTAHPSVINHFLTNKFSAVAEDLADDDISDMKAIIDDINDGDDHTLWAQLAKADEDDTKGFVNTDSISLTEATVTPRYYVYDASGNVVSDGFIYSDDAIDYAIGCNHPTVKVHKYFTSDGKTYPDGDPEIFWQDGGKFDSTQLSENVIGAKRDIFCYDCDMVTTQTYKGEFKDGSRTLGRYVCTRCGCENEDEPIAEDFDVDTVQKRIASTDEFDNGYVIEGIFDSKAKKQKIYTQLISDTFEGKAATAIAAEVASASTSVLADVADSDSNQHTSSDSKARDVIRMIKAAKNNTRKNRRALIKSIIALGQKYARHCNELDTLKEINSKLNKLAQNTTKGYKATEYLLDTINNQLNTTLERTIMFLKREYGIVESLDEDGPVSAVLYDEDSDDITYEADFYDDDEGVYPHKDFDAEGCEWTWVQKQSDSVYLDFDNWAVWEALNQDTSETAYFVVEEDTEFIDWGPVDTVEEATEFLQSKVNDYKLEESTTTPSSNKYIITAQEGALTLYYNAKNNTFSTDSEDATQYSEKVIVEDDYNEINKSGYHSVNIQKVDDYKLEKSFNSGDIVYVKPSKKTGKVTKVNGDYIDVEISGGDNPDRIDTFYSSDLELRTTSIHEATTSANKGDQWYVGDEESGRIYYSEADAKAAYDNLQISTTLVGKAIMQKLEESCSLQEDELQTPWKPKPEEPYNANEMSDNDYIEYMQRTKKLMSQHITPEAFEEVSDFKFDVTNADTVEDIQDLIYGLSDGVAEDNVQTDFNHALNTTDNLDEIKDAVITAIDVYLEDNDYLIESFNEKDILHKLDQFQSQITVDKADEKKLKDILRNKHISFIIDDSDPEKLKFKLKYDSNRNFKKLKESESKVIPFDFDFVNIAQYQSELEQFLMSNNFHVDEVATSGAHKIIISIEDGDWKHQHLQLDRLVTEFFAEKDINIAIDQKVTAEDGSDTYSADHYISSMDMDNTKNINEATEDDEQWVVVRLPGRLIDKVRLVPVVIEAWPKDGFDFAGWARRKRLHTYAKSQIVYRTNSEEDAEAFIAANKDKTYADKLTENVQNTLNEYFNNGDRVTCDYYADARHKMSGTVVGGFRMPGASTYTVEWDDGTKSKIIGSYLTRENKLSEDLSGEYSDKFKELANSYLKDNDIEALESLCANIIRYSKEADLKDLWFDRGYDKQLVEDSSDDVDIYYAAIYTTPPMPKAERKKIYFKCNGDFEDAESRVDEVISEPYTSVRVLGTVIPSQAEKDGFTLVECALTEDIDTQPLEGPSEGPEAGLASLLNTAIQDEFKTIQLYNDLAVTARAEGFEDIATVIDTINTDENTHVGQLQQLLTTVSPNAQAIDNDDDDVVVIESLGNDADELVKQLFTEYKELWTPETSDTIFDEICKTYSKEVASKVIEDLMDANNSNSSPNNNSEDILEESNMNRADEIYQSFKTIEQELNGDGEAITSVVDKLYNDNKNDPDYKKAYDRWASGK